MKKIETFFSILFIPVDYVLLILAGLSAYRLRFSDWSANMRPIVFNLQFPNYLHSLFFISFLWILLLAISGIYSIRSARKLAQEIKKIFFACAAGFALIAIIIFFRRELFDSRFIVLIGSVFALLYLSIAHAFIRWLQRRLYKFGIGVHKVILVGNSKTTDNLIVEFSSNKKAGFEVIKRIRDFSLETAQELSEFIKGREVDEIIQSDPNLTKAETLRLYDFTNENHITFKYVADLLEVKVLRTDVTEIIGIPVVEVKRTTLEGWGRVFKRIFDIIFSHCTQTDFISYEDINGELIKRKWEEVPPKKVAKRILNAINNGIFRFAKIEDKKFKNELLNGDKILKTIRGR